MRAYTYGLLVVLFTGCILGGCAKKEVIKTEEQVVPAVVAAPEAPPPPVPEPPRPAPVPPPEPVKADVIPSEPPQKAVLPETMQEVTLETIHFDFDKSDLRDPDREILTRNAGILMNTLIKSNVRIEGHCDERGSAEYNLALGERRARSAMDYLITLGVPAGRLSIISYGKEKPIDPGHDEDAWAKNRRAQFMKMGE